MNLPQRPRFRACHAMTLFAAVFGAVFLAVQTVSAALSVECMVPPRQASEFVLPTDPAVAEGSLLIVDDWSQLPTGTPATAEEAAAAQAFAELYTACQNTGDLGRLTALYTDAMFRGSLANRLPLPFQPQNPFEALYAFLFDPNGKDAAEASAQLAQDISAPPTPLSPPMTDAEVQDVRVLPDGRLGAILVQDARPTEFQIYARVDGRLLLDERVDFRMAGSERPEATPELPEASGAMGGDLSECTVEPIGLPEVEAMLAALPPEANVVADVVPVDELPVGSPANPESVDAVVALEHEFVACLNLQDWPRVMALLTGAGLRTLVEGSDRSAAEHYQATPVSPSAEEQE